MDFDDAEAPIDPPPLSDADPVLITAPATETDGVGGLLRRFGEPATGTGRASVPGLAKRFTRMPVPRARPGAPPGRAEPPAATPEPAPTESAERPAATNQTLTEARPEPRRPLAALAGSIRTRARSNGLSRLNTFAGRVHSAALRLAGNDRERLRRWLSVTGTAIAVAVVAYVIGAMVAGLLSADTRRHAQSDKPAAPSVQLAVAKPNPPPPAEPSAAAAPPSEPAARAAFFLVRAKAGDPIAQYNLGVLYVRGDGLVQDYASAASWFHAAAAQGNLDAEYNLAVLYERGLGVTASAIDAVNWYRSAADQNHARAQFNLAIAYAEGRGTEQDFAAAGRWYQRAAQQGLVPAMVNLAILYELGQGVDRSPADAYAWYSAAGERGDVSAKDRAAELFRRFSDKDKAKAQGLAAAVAAAINGAPPA